MREALKHSSVDEVVMVEIDGELAEIARKHLPEWSDCSDIAVGGVDDADAAAAGQGRLSCFDDPRAIVRYEDAFGYFVDNFGVADEEEEEKSLEEEGEEEEYDDDDGWEDEFDVIIMDALDPDDYGDFVDKLYNE